MRVWGICLATLLAVALAGCVPVEQHRKLKLHLQEVEGERDGCQQALRDELAKSADLTERLRNQERVSASADAEVNALRARVETLQRQNDEIAALIEQRASQPLERPAVPAALLPPELDQALQEFAGKFQHRLWYDRGRGAVSFANDRLFESGSDTVRPDAHAALHELAGIAARALPAQYELVVVGHSDDAPITKEETLARHPTNWHLSVHRAIAVKDVLVKAGLPAKRLGVMGYGPYRPVSDDRSRNRRVEVFFTRIGDVQSFAPVRPER